MLPTTSRYSPTGPTGETCEYRGVTLGSFECLEYLNLSRSGLGGVVPHHLGNLSRLQYLDLRNSFVLDNIDYDHHQTRTRFVKFVEVSIMDGLGWVSTLSSLRHLDLSGINIGKYIDWFHPVNMLSSLRTLNFAWSDIDILPLNPSTSCLLIH
ncbi:putative leucine-rich repeat domain superfamily [Helianthus annuus]|nr:putative leucine-rich repeat domain superfamily [Helianthus annuus]